MAVQVSYPGVYIEEFTPGAPIQGVGTATAAFLGPASDGPLNEPTKITSWESFLRTFGADPLDGFYLWYAVRGFFENSGLVCYIVRVSNGKADGLVRNDRNAGGAQPTIEFKARVPGDNTANPITVEIADAGAVTTTLFRPTAAVDHASGDVIEVKTAAVADAAKFLPGNQIVIEGGGKRDSVAVQRVEGKLIRLTGNLPAPYLLADNATVRLANLTANVDDTLRVVDGSKLASGSVITIAPTPATTANTDTVVVRSVSAERLPGGLTTYRVVLRDKLTKSFDLSAATAIDVNSLEFAVTVAQGTYSRTYDDLSMDPGHPKYFASVIGNDPAGRIFAAAVEPPNTTPAPDNRPAVTTAAVPLTGGAPDSRTTLQPQDYKTALAKLEAIDDINMIAIPDETSADVQMAMIAHCERTQDRFAILDSWRGARQSGGGSVVDQRHGVDSTDGFAALYYPWLFVAPVTGPGRVLVPPSGHVAGVYARTDTRRGVHKAPAGEEALLNGVLGVEFALSDTEQGQLNLSEGINVIRVFKGGGRAVVWGARTTATNRSWQYVNVRRLFLFLEESIEEGIRWAVFEPNTQTLWKKLNRTITAFLTQQWRDGAMYGAKPEDAFYVRIDEVLNPDAERALGRLHLEIGIRPAYPAEFIIVRIGIWQGGSEVTTS